MLKADLDSFESKLAPSLKYFKRLIVKEDRLEVVLLRGHLLLEAAMREFVEAHAQRLPKRRLSYGNLIDACAMLGLFGPYPNAKAGPEVDLEKVLLDIDNARNALAHDIEANEKKIVGILLTNAAKQPFIRFQLEGDDLEKLKVLISLAYAYMRGLGSGLALSRHIERRRTRGPAG